MKAKGYFWLLAALMGIALGFVTWVLFQQSFSWYIWVAEGLTVAVGALLYLVYHRVVRPIQLIGNGLDLLHEQDFGSRLRPVGQQDADRVVDVFNTMMGRLKDEKLHIREQHQFLDLLIASSPVGVVILDFDGKPAVTNPAARTILENQGQALTAVLEALPDGEQTTVHTDDGNIYHCTRSSFLESGFHRTFYLIEPLTQEVLKAEQKAYGQVIRMISHEVNNSMAGVSSSLETAQAILDSSALSILDSTAPVALSDAADLRALLALSTARCMSLSQFITDFANVVKIPEPRLEPIDLNAFLTSRLRFFESLCVGKQITLETDFSPEVGLVSLDPVLMEQVLVNIVKNAVESIDTTGTILLRTQPTSAQPATTPSTSAQPTTGGATLILADNGLGIPPQIATQLFTPFFSTKNNGQGIGLTLIRDILQKHHARFSLRTYPDGWTRFTIHYI